jgi:hypothetical protein
VQGEVAGGYAREKGADEIGSGRIVDAFVRDPAELFEDDAGKMAVLGCAYRVHGVIFILGRGKKSLES